MNSPGVEWVEKAEKILAPFRLIRPEGMDTGLMVLGVEDINLLSRRLAEALSDAYDDGFFAAAIDSPVNR